VKSLIISIAIIALLAGGVGFFRSGSGDATGVGMIEAGISFKEEAGLTLQVTNLANRMRQAQAQGAIDAVVAKPVLDDLDALHAQVEESRKRMAASSGGAGVVDQWLRKVDWEGFQKQEEAFRAMAK
jgi:hypothetical protein